MGKRIYDLLPSIAKKPKGLMCYYPALNNIATIEYQEMSIEWTTI